MVANVSLKIHVNAPLVGMVLIVRNLYVLLLVVGIHYVLHLTHVHADPDGKVMDVILLNVLKWNVIMVVVVLLQTLVHVLTVGLIPIALHQSVVILVRTAVDALVLILVIVLVIGQVLTVAFQSVNKNVKMVVFVWHRIHVLVLHNTLIMIAPILYVIKVFLKRIHPLIFLRI
jgi:hypothetical protein